MKKQKTFFSTIAVSLIFLSFYGCKKSVNHMKLHNWVIEDTSGSELIIQQYDTLNIASPGGMTLWYHKPFHGNYEIKYQICFPMDDSGYDRLSDMNCFWAANDPLYPDNIFERSDWRDGIFEHYNSLNLFYVGYGGNENKTTRFRCYRAEFYEVDNSRIKPLLQEYTDSDYLLKSNHWYKINIRVVDGDYTTYTVDGKTLFSYRLEPNQGDGYFGLRLYQNHVLFTGFDVQ